MNFIKAIDAKILSFFTKISHKFQRLTGRTNFFLAKICLCVLALSVMVMVANYWFPLLGRDGNIFSLIVSVVFIFIARRMYYCDKAEDEVLTEEKTNFFAEDNNLMGRILLLFLSILDLFGFLMAINMPRGILIFKVLDCLYFPVYSAFMYFIVVMPLPPGKSKIQEWAENISAYFKKFAQI